MKRGNGLTKSTLQRDLEGKRWGLWLMALSLLLTLALLISCGPSPQATPTPAPAPKPTSAPAPSPTSSPAPAPKPTTGPAPTAAEVGKPIQMTLSTYQTPTHAVTTGILIPFINEVEKRTNGRLKITFYHSEALGKASEHFDLARTGVADFARISPALVAGRFPLSDITTLPGLVDSATNGSKAFWQLYNTGLLDKEYQDVKVVFLGTNSPQQLEMAKKRVSTVAELKGLKIRIGGGHQADMLSVVGASPVSISTGDIYLSLSRGVIDGILIGYYSIPGYKLQEIIKYATDARAGVDVVGIAANKASWARLPADIQGIITKLGEEVATSWAGKVHDDADGVGIEAMRKAGVEVYPWPAEERTKWLELSKPLFGKFVSESEAKGMPGKKVLDEFVKILKGLGVVVPYTF